MTNLIKTLYNTIANEDKLASTYIKEGFEFQKDEIAENLINLIENGEFIHQDKSVTIANIFEKEPNGWTEKLYNLEYNYINLKFVDKNLKEITATNKAMLAKMITLLNNIKTSKENYTLSYIFKNHRKILKDIIEYRIKNTKNLTTLKNDLTGITYIFTNYNNGDKHLINQSKIYKSLESDLSFHIISTKADNKMTKKDLLKIVPYAKLLEVQGNLKINMETLFAKVGKDNATYRKVHMQYIALSLMLLSPTLRLEYYNMKITNDITKTTNKVYDYLYIPPTGKIQYILNITKKGHKGIQYELGIINNAKINYTGDNISEIIRTSYTIYPRTDLFETTSKKSYSRSGFQKIVGDILSNKQIGVNSVRSSFCTFIKPKSNTVLVNTAMKMRTSIDMIISNYTRIDYDTDDEVDTSDVDPIIQPILSVKTVEKLPSDTMKAYYEKNKDVVLQKQRDRFDIDKPYILARKVIAYLNKNVKSVPTDDSKKTHELYEKDGKWCSKIVDLRKA